VKQIHKYIGLDVHKVTIMIAVAEGGRDGEVRVYGKIRNDLHELERTLRKLGGAGIVLHVVYEAGPTGYVIHRRLQQLEIDCIVVQATKGKTQKTDRRDAQQLARLHRAGEMIGINVPDAVDETIRDLTRGRADVVDDLRRAKQRLKSFLLRHGYSYVGKANWSEAHRRYLREITFPLPTMKAVLEESIMAIEQTEERLRRFDELLSVHVPKWRWYPAVQALMCLRGFQLTAASVFIAELGDLQRFRHPRHLMAFLGLVPNEKTSGEHRRLGAITKAGNIHARWILVEAVQHALLPPKVSAPLALRQEGQPRAYRELAWKVQTRLHKRGWHLMRRGVMKPKITVALARELAGFLWALLRLVPSPQV